MTSLPPRPKPWETNTSTSTAGPSKAQSGSGSGLKTTASASTSAFDTALQASSSNAAPKIPDRPAGLGLADGGTSYGVSTYQPQQRYGVGVGNSYMSPYGGGLGGMGGIGGYGSYGGYGGMSRFGGGYGGGYGMGGYGVGGMGGPGEGFPTLTSSLQASTAPAFAVLESLVTAFTSLAQLVESTYMATHSSFFAMVGVADQLGSLKSYLGQVLGVFSLLRLGKRIVAWVKGKGKGKHTGLVGAGVGWANEWTTNGLTTMPKGQDQGGGGKPSAKPLLLFLLSAVGLPYLMSRLIRLLIAQQQQQQQTLLSNGSGSVGDGMIDPTKIEFARCKYPFEADPRADHELSLGREEIVAILEKRDPPSSQGNTPEGGGERGWWRGRTRDGRVGWFPGNYVEMIQRQRRDNQSQSHQP